MNLIIINGLYLNRFFLGYLQEETYRKMEDLCSMKEKLVTAKQDYQNEWVSAGRSKGYY